MKAGKWSDPVYCHHPSRPPHHPSQRQNRPHWRCHPHPHGGGLHRHRSGGVGYPGPGPQPHLCVHPGHEQNRSGGHPGFRGGHPQWELRSQHHVPPRVLTIQEIPTYTVTVPTAENGTITADKATAQEGDTVTLTARPAEGYVLQSLTATCAAAAPGTVPLQEKGGGDLHLCHARRGRHRHRNLRPGRGGRGTLAALPLYRCAGDHVVL